MWLWIFDVKQLEHEMWYPRPQLFTHVLQFIESDPSSKIGGAKAKKKKTNKQPNQKHGMLKKPLCSYEGTRRVPYAYAYVWVDAAEQFVGRPNVRNFTPRFRTTDSLKPPRIMAKTIKFAPTLNTLNDYAQMNVTDYRWPSHASIFSQTSASLFPPSFFSVVWFLHFDCVSTN